MSCLYDVFRIIENIQCIVVIIVYMMSFQQILTRVFLHDFIIAWVNRKAREWVNKIF